MINGNVGYSIDMGTALKIAAKEYEKRPVEQKFHGGDRQEEIAKMANEISSNGVQSLIEDDGFEIIECVPAGSRMEREIALEIAMRKYDNKTPEEKLQCDCRCVEIPKMADYIIANRNK